ncbi:hypothetical protein [Actinokineospora pegani]|uniref:hypothetical protein n=1 Tax=Actinokineospora pegani TaxID=2654637 RepID=UPI0012EA23AD|nr:hypothetical protein [Actinokineospora pegani]
MDDEQRTRMADVRKHALIGLGWTAAFTVVAVVVALVTDRHWTALLHGPGSLLLMLVIYVIGSYRYIRRGPFPRLPAIRRDPPWPPQPGEKA